MVSVLDFRSSSLGSSIGRGSCVVFLATHGFAGGKLTKMLQTLPAID